jgi:hypothetical protein
MAIRQVAYLVYARWRIFVFSGKSWLIVVEELGHRDARGQRVPLFTENPRRPLLGFSGLEKSRGC